MPKKQRSFAKAAKAPFNPIPPVPPVALRDMVNKGLVASDHLSEFDDALPVFMTAIAGGDQSVDRLTSAMLKIRSFFCFTALWESEERFKVEGLILQNLKGGLILTSEFMRAIAGGPLRAAIGSSSLMEIDFDVEDIVAEGKRLQAEGPRQEVTLDFGPNTKPQVMTGPGIGGIASLLASDLSSDFDARGTPPPFRPALADFPEYAALCKARERMLSAIPVADRAVFEAPLLPDDDRTLQVLSTVTDGAPADIAKILLKVAGAGPWSRYPQLNDAPGWSYEAYKRVALSSRQAIGIPCKRGLTAAYYAGVHGSLEDLRTVLDLRPSAVRSVDACGRPLLADLLEIKGSAAKVRLLLERGASPHHLIPPNGMSLFQLCIALRDYRSAELLVEFGYDPSLDISLDQGQVAEMLEIEDLPGNLRAMLHCAQPLLPKTSTYGEIKKISNESLRDLSRSKMQ